MSSPGLPGWAFWQAINLACSPAQLTCGLHHRGSGDLPAARPNHPKIVKLVARAAGPGVSFLSNIFLSCRRGPHLSALPLKPA